MSDETITPTEQPATPAPAAPAPNSEIIRERFEAVAARHGLDEAATELVAPAAHAWLERNGRAGTKADLAEFMADMKVKTPKLFASAPSASSAPMFQNTAPTVANAASAPAPAAIETPYGRWRALLDAGRRAEAEAYYLVHRGAILRS